MMKYFIIIISLLFSTNIMAQENTKVPIAQIEVPDVVKKQFAKEFPNAQKTTWEKEKENFEAEFHLASSGAEAIFTPKGKLLKFKKEIPEQDLPVAIVESIDKMYQGEKFDDVRIVVIGDEVYYQMEIENTYMDEQLVFHENGKLAKDVKYWN